MKKQLLWLSQLMAADSPSLRDVQREMFPNTIVAGMFNFKEAALLKLEDEAARTAPKVKFT